FYVFSFLFFFFFQAEDGIRDRNVTGVQTCALPIFSLVIGIPFSYFYSFYSIKGSKLIYVLSIMCVMSAPFLGAYSWILLLGRSGSITIFFKNYLGINLKNIYGFSGILLVQSLKLFPLIFIYMNGAFKDIDSS